MARVVGALPSEVAMMNTLTANIHFMFASFYRPTPTRHKILIEKKAFPSDVHAVVSQILLHQFSPSDSLIELSPREGEETLRLEDIAAVIRVEGPSIAVIHFSGIQYYTGQLFNMAEITRLGHEQGCIVGFDLAHAAGNVVLQLHDWNVDFATWCSYKYLNSGPGGVGGCFVHSQHTSSGALRLSPESSIAPIAFESAASIPNALSLATGTTPRLAGWWGHRLSDRFLMASEFIADEGANGFRVSNPSPLLIASLRASLDVFDSAGGIQKIREKSVKITKYLEDLLLQELSGEVRIFTPSDPAQRGAQLSVTFTQIDSVERVNSLLKEKGIICDTRKPNVIRIAPAPLYNSYKDVYHFVKLLKESLEEIRSSSSSRVA
jgi:kynureninase